MVQKIICRTLSVGKLARLCYQSVENILWLITKPVEHFLSNILMSKIFLGLWENALSNIFCRKLYVFPYLVANLVQCDTFRFSSHGRECNGPSDPLVASAAQLCRSLVSSNVSNTDGTRLWQTQRGQSCKQHYVSRVGAGQKAFVDRLRNSVGTC